MVSLTNFCRTELKPLLFSLGYQAFMLSLKSQISVLDNFVIREESISPVLAMMSKENAEHLQNIVDGSTKDVSKQMFLSASLAKQTISKQSVDGDVIKSTDNKINTSGGLITNANHPIERKISIEEKRSLTNSHKANSLNSSQQLNDSGKSISSAEHNPHKISNGELREEDENVFIDNDDSGRCSLM